MPGGSGWRQPGLVPWAAHLYLSLWFLFQPRMGTRNLPSPVVLGQWRSGSGLGEDEGDSSHVLLGQVDLSSALGVWLTINHADHGWPQWRRHLLVPRHPAPDSTIRHQVRLLFGP